MVLGKESTDVLDDTAIIFQEKYSVNATQSRRKICLSLRYNTSYSVLFANGVKIHQFNAQESEIKPYPFCLRQKIKKDNMEKPELNGSSFFNVNHIINTHKYLMTKYEIAWIHKANVYCFGSDANKFWYIIAQKM